MKTQSIERARAVVKQLHARNHSIWNELDRETVHAINALVAYAEWLKAPPTKVSALEFVEMVYEKEHLVGKPIVWAEWPCKENA